jgi:ubiquinone/menaquinone biosynthesis C-methylase UbiE
MLDYAANKQGLDSRITWRQADALELPFDDASFDVVVCQFSPEFRWVAKLIQKSAFISVA